MVCQVAGCATHTVESLSTKVTRGALTTLCSGERLPHLAAPLVCSYFVLVMLVLNVIRKIAGRTTRALENLSTDVARGFRPIFTPCETFPNLAPLLSPSCWLFTIGLQVNFHVFLH